GLACARAFCGEGHRVIGVARGEQTLNELAGELEGFTGIACDISDDASVAALGSRIADAVGDRTVDVLINNAGYGAAGPVELVDIKEWRAQFDVNVFGTVAVTQVVLPFLRNSTRPRIINVSSVAGRVYVPFFGPYYSSKHALECISDVLRMELSDQGIDVTLVEPGAVQTGFQDHEDAMLERYASQSELYRKSIGRVVAWHRALADDGVQPEVIVETIQAAVRAENPKVRYVVPKLPPVAFIALARLLPSRLTDRLVRRIVKL
ncbi:MAG: SDR family NAD(P)-dependent oxidoreductase, partial [Deltaproteobacteria bacterium]|nr:SDR family NAD(P)-dependent oxidoreductase [Deltaproteobacteria bacterium]